MAVPYVALSGVAVFAGAALQSATGFGFALVCAPVLVAVLGPQEGVGTALVLALLVNGATLTAESRAAAVLRPEAVGLTVWSLPGLALGAVALRELPASALEIAVAVAVLVALGVRLRARRPGPDAAQPTHAGAPHRTAVAGACAGALSTATSLSGPPLVLHLLALRAGPEQLRDTLAAVFLALAALSLAALLVAGALQLPGAALAALAAVAVAGQLLGRRIFATLGAERHERAVLAVLAATALGAMVAGAV